MMAAKRLLPVMAVLSLLLLAGLGALHAKSMSNGAPALNCAQCHQGAQNRPVKFVIEGLPSNGKYEPGKTYKITIKITEGPKCNPSVACGGFAFYASAGKIIVTDKKDTFISTLPDGKKIITHTKAGSKKREWSFEWQAPSTPEKVTIIVSVLAANGDGSFNGDAFAQKTIVLEPAGGATTSKPSPTTTVIKTTTVKTVTSTTPVTTTVGYKTSHNTGVAVGVAILIFLVVVGGYLLYARK